MQSKTLQGILQNVIDSPDSDETVRDQFLFDYKENLFIVEVIREKNKNSGIEDFLRKRSCKISISMLVNVFKTALPRAVKEAHYTPNTFYRNAESGQLFSIVFLFRHASLPLAKIDTKTDEQKKDKSEKRRSRILEIITNAKETGILLSDITVKTPQATIDERRQILDFLEEAHLINKESFINSRGKPAERYFAIKPDEVL